MIDPDELPEPEDERPVRRALLSVYDKSGIVEFARTLDEHDVELVSTGGTAEALREDGLAVTEVSSLTGHPEILEGRVKTLHPAIHGAILARRGLEQDRAELAEHEIEPIDLVVVNLYPFESVTADPGTSEALALEQIDIGGPTLIRAAAKNHFDVGVVTSPSQYDPVSEELDRHAGNLTLATRRALASTAFARTAEYDRAVTDYFRSRRGPLSEDGDADREGAGQDAPPESDLPDRIRIDEPRVQSLRYGENPHQQASHYGRTAGIYRALHGKALSFNNLQDLSAALQLIAEFADHPPTCAILKHTNPCGLAVRSTLEEAYRAAFATDRQSPYGGIVVVNRALDRATAEAIDEIFTELIIAPEFESGVLEFLKEKEKRRIIQADSAVARTEGDEAPERDVRSVVGGLLVQDRDPTLPPLPTLRDGWDVATERAPTDAEWTDLDVAWRVVKHVKSNAIVYVGDRATLGIGAGQMSRVDSSEIAVAKSEKSELDLEGSVVASDAFFPFADGLVAAAEAGARAAIQPGGSIRDEEVIHAADDHDVAMVMTGRRHFRH